MDVDEDLSLLDEFLDSWRVEIKTSKYCPGTGDSLLRSTQVLSLISSVQESGVQLGSVQNLMNPKLSAL